MVVMTNVTRLLTLLWEFTMADLTFSSPPEYSNCPHCYCPTLEPHNEVEAVCLF